MHKMGPETKGLLHLTLTWTYSYFLPLADTNINNRDELTE